MVDGGWWDGVSMRMQLDSSTRARGGSDNILIDYNL